MHRLQGILETALGQKMVLPERKIESIEIFLARFPEVKTVIFDGTERAVQRPQDNEKQNLTQARKNGIPANTSLEQHQTSGSYY